MHSHHHSSTTAADSAHQRREQALALLGFIDQLELIEDANQALSGLADLVDTANRSACLQRNPLAHLIDCVAQTMAQRIQALHEAIECRRLALDAAPD